MLKPFRSLAVLAAYALKGDVLLLLATLAALALANSALAPLYFTVLNWHSLGISPLHFINDGLMAVFFLGVGLEIKREFVDGALTTWPSRTLPALSAFGGMLVPCLIYVAFNYGDRIALRGWAIPAATDIAFALGILAVLGRRVPGSLKVFLTALAILDDLGAILIIALFYAGAVNFSMLGLAALILGFLALLNARNMLVLWPYMVGFFGIWLCFMFSGLHATLAGVVTALVVPLRAGQHSPLERLEHGLAPVIAQVIVPVFGFANAGVALGAFSISALFGTVPLGIALGLLVGKQVGVFSFAYAGIKTGFCDMPAGSSWRQIYGISLLCGIGFTMSLFIGSLAFGTQPDLAGITKVGVLAGSLLAAGFGLLVLRRG